MRLPATDKGPESLSAVVEAFYDKCPFPGFDLGRYGSPDDLVRQASQFARVLDSQIPTGAEILDVGCGTGQLACFLSLRGRTVLGVDLSERALEQARALKSKLQLPDVSFRKANVLMLDLPVASFDYVFCTGVLHHTPDPATGFKHLVRVVREGGFIILGLYSKYGRLMLRVRKAFHGLQHPPDEEAKYQRMRGQWSVFDKDPVKTASWYQDQYLHPHESLHSIGQVMAWFREANVTYVNSIPAIELLRRYSPTLKVFQRREHLSFNYTAPAYLLVQLGWIYSLRSTGGYFLILGQKGESR